MALASMFTKTYTTYSGVDITAIFDNISLATLTGIAISVTREKAPVYTFGSANPRSISRGKRGTAGSLMFTLFDRDAFYGLFLSEEHKYYAHADEMNWLTNPTNVSNNIGLFYQQSQLDAANAAVGQGGELAGLGRQANGNFAIDTNEIDPVTGQPVNNAPTLGQNPVALQAGQQIPGNGAVGARTVRRAAFYADQVMPFDITLIAQNEYGHASASGVVGVEIINEGGGISMDDITNEQQCTYIAIYRLPWYSLTNGIQKETIFGGVTSLVDNTTIGPNNGIITRSITTGSNEAQVAGQ